MQTNSIEYQNLSNELKALIIKTANLEDLKPEDIDDESPLFQEGLGLDSIDLLEIIVQLDKKYGIKIQNDEAGRAALNNITNLTKTVLHHKSQKVSS